MRPRIVRFGCIGVGEVAERFHLPALLRVPSAKLYSVFSRDEERALHLQRTFGSEVSYSDTRAFFEDEKMDAVIIAAPDREHVPLAGIALTHGTHMLIEKPLSLGVDQVDEFERAASHTKCIIAVGYHLRHHAGHQLLHRHIRDGELGELRQIKLVWCYDWTNNVKERERYVVYSLGVHLIDLAKWFITDDLRPHVRVLKVTSLSKNDLHVFLEIAGCTVEIECNGLRKEPYRLELRGTEGVATGTYTFGPRGSGDIHINGEQLVYTSVNPYEAQLADLVSAILIQTPLTSATLAEGVWNTHIVNQLKEHSDAP